MSPCLGALYLSMVNILDKKQESQTKEFETSDNNEPTVPTKRTTGGARHNDKKNV